MRNLVYKNLPTSARRNEISHKLYKSMLTGESSHSQDHTDTHLFLFKYIILKG